MKDFDVPIVALAAVLLLAALTGGCAKPEDKFWKQATPVIGDILRNG